MKPASNTTGAKFRWLSAIAVAAWSWALSFPIAKAAELLVADRLTSSVYRYSPDGQFLGLLFQDTTNLNGADGIQVSPDLSELYVSSNNNNNLVRYDYNHLTETVSNPTVIASTASGLSFPSSIVFDATGSTMYVSNLNQRPPAGVAQLTPGGAVVGPPLIGGTMGAYSGLALAPNGELVVGGFQTLSQTMGGVLKSNLDISTISNLVAPTASLNGVAAILVRGNDVYVTAGFTGRVNAYNVTTGAPDPSVAAFQGLEFPAAIALAPDGNSLLISSLGFATGGGYLSSYPLTGGLGTIIATSQTNPANGFEEPTAMVMIPDITPVSGNWIVNVTGRYGIASNWDGGRTPNGQGVTATFGSSSGVTGAGPALTVTVNGAFTAGSLVFNNSTVSFSLATDGISGHMLTLDNGSTGAAGIAVMTGSHTIAAPLNLTNGVTVTTATDPSASAPSLTISGPINGAGGIVKTGDGTLRLTATNGYLGDTIVNGGVLRTSAANALGSGGGALAVNSSGGTTLVELAAAQTVSNLSGSVSSGSATLRLDAPLTINQMSDSTLQANLTLTSSAQQAASMIMSGRGTLTVTGATAIGDNTSIMVSDHGTLELSPSAASIGQGVLVSIDSDAKLQLGGAASPLGSANAATRAHIIDNGALVAAGIGQIVGRIDGGGQNTLGLGSLIVSSSSSLQVDSLSIQTLSIGSGGSLTIDATDAMGNSIGSSSLVGDYGVTVSGPATALPEPPGLSMLVIGCLAGGAIFAVGRAKTKVQ